MDGYNAKDLALAELLNKDKFPVEVDITQDVLSERIPREELADALDGEKELARLKIELKDAHSSWLKAKDLLEALEQQKLRRKMLLEKKVPPTDDNDKRLLALSEKNLIDMEATASKKERTAFKQYKEIKAELKDHRKEIKNNGEQDTSRIYMRNGRYYQWWDRLPSWMEKYQPSKERPEDVYREIRKMVVLDLPSLNHVDLVALLERYK